MNATTSLIRPKAVTKPESSTRRVEGEQSPAPSLYAMACAWSEKTNRIFQMLQDAEELLKVETPNCSALAILSSSLEQLRNFDEEATLLNALADLKQAKPMLGPSDQDISSMHFDASCYLECALAVLELHAESEGKAAIYGLRDLLRVYHDKADEKRGEISQRDLDDLSAEIEIVQELVCHALERSELDSVVLHAVDYLLRDAKEIADGERCQLEEVSRA